MVSKQLAAALSKKGINPALNLGSDPLFSPLASGLSSKKKDKKKREHKQDKKSKTKTTATKRPSTATNIK